MTARHRNLRPRPESGFTLIEALIALLIVSFGMLAIAGFQITLSFNADVAKQRSEALRLAQQKIEQYRSFQQTTGDGHPGTVFDYADDVITETGEAITGYTSNTTFTRNTTVTGAAADARKWVNVQVTWPDRLGATQSVNLQTVISRSDPNDIGTLATGPGTVTSRTPKNRNINIPYPAVPLAGGKSGFLPPTASRFYVFDNTSGDILGYCTNTGLLTENATIDVNGASPTASCTSQAAYLLSGYIRFFDGNNPAAADVENPIGNSAETGNLSVTIAFADRSPVLSNPDVTCYAQRQVVAVNTSTGSNIMIAADSTPPTGYSLPAANQQTKFVAYACVVVPIDGPNSTRNEWAGQTLITPLAASGTAITWSLDTSTDASGSTVTSTGTKRVCRYTGDYIIDNVLSNSEHPLHHRGVTGALDNQNFVVINRAYSCPVDRAVNPLASDYINTNTTVHQLHVPTALLLPVATYGTAFGGALTGSNSGGANNNGGFTITEPSSTTAYLPMFETGN